MDNASKAIMMAGGVLIAIALISVAVFTYNSAKGFARSSEEVLSASQIQSFNRFYLEYRNGSGTNSSTIKCIDAINILNRALDDEIDIEMTSTLISKPSATSTFYSADTKDYTTKTVSYTIGYDSVGKVDKVIIN